MTHTTPLSAIILVTMQKILRSQLEEHCVESTVHTGLLHALPSTFLFLKLTKNTQKYTEVHLPILSGIIA